MASEGFLDVGVAQLGVRDDGVRKAGSLGSVLEPLRLLDRVFGADGGLDVDCLRHVEGAGQFDEVLCQPVPGCEFSRPRAEEGVVFVWLPVGVVEFGVVHVVEVDVGVYEFGVRHCALLGRLVWLDYMRVGRLHQSGRASNLITPILAFPYRGGRDLRQGRDLDLPDGVGGNIILSEIYGMGEVYKWLATIFL